MLRRKPTALTITSEDLIAFEESQRQKSQENNNGEPAATAKHNSGHAFDPNDELKPLPGDKARIVRSREERIGVTRRG